MVDFRLGGNLVEVSSRSHLFSRRKRRSKIRRERGIRIGKKNNERKKEEKRKSIRGNNRVSASLCLDPSAGSTLCFHSADTMLMFVRASQREYEVVR